MLEKLRSTARKKKKKSHKHHFVRVRWLLRTRAALEDELPVGDIIQPGLSHLTLSAPTFHTL